MNHNGSNDENWLETCHRICFILRVDPCTCGRKVMNFGDVYFALQSFLIHMLDSQEAVEIIGMILSTRLPEDDFSGIVNLMKSRRGNASIDDIQNALVNYPNKLCKSLVILMITNESENAIFRCFFKFQKYLYGTQIDDVDLTAC